MASTYLSRTFTSNSVSNRKFTYSFWIKRNGLGECTMTSAYQSGTYFAGIKFLTDDRFELYDYRGSYILQKTTSRKFRDTNAWYHIVIASDTSVSTPDTKIYINGVEETAFDTNTDYNQNASTSFNHSYNNTIGAFGGSSYQQHVDGAITHFHFCDGYTYQASDFGETDSTTGIWKPKTAPSVTYGTNGFFLKFENSASMGTDSAGSNNWTVNGTMTQLIDTPSNIFNTLNPLAQSGGISFNLSNTNTTLGDNGSGDNDQGLAGTLAVSAGKYYWEVKSVNGGDVIGFKKTDAPIVFSSTDGTPNAGFWGFQSNGSGSSINTYSDGTFNNSNTLQGHANNDIVMFALDMDNGKFFYGRNGSWLGVDNNSADPVNGTNAVFTNIPTDGTLITTWTEHRSSGNPATHWNWGNGYFGTTAVSSAQNPDDGIGIFEYDVPAGYRALCTKSINAEEYS